MSAATMNEVDRLIRERDELAEKLAVATKRLEDGHLAPVGWISGDRYEAVSREKMDYRRRWKEVCEERDALSATLERLHNALDPKLLDWIDCGMAANNRHKEAWARELRNELHLAMAAKPDTALARLKAQWQAEALERCAEGVAACKPGATPRGISIAIRLEANDYRRQAEEPDQ